MEPIWSEDEKVVIPLEGGNLKEGEVVCLTPLAYPADGVEVVPTIDGITPEIERPEGGPGGRNLGAGKGKGKGKGRVPRKKQNAPGQVPRRLPRDDPDR